VFRVLNDAFYREVLEQAARLYGSAGWSTLKAGEIDDEEYDSDVLRKE